MDRTKISFAQAEGKARFPAVLKWGEIDQRLRSSLWTPLFVFFEDHLKDHPYKTPGWYLTDPAGAMMTREFVLRRHLFVSDYVTYFYKDEFLKIWSEFFKKSDYVEMFDFLTYLIRDPDCPEQLITNLSNAFDQPFSPYRLSIESRTIYPAIDEAQTAALNRDIAAAFSSPFEGSKSHLQSALDELGRNAFRASVRESINAVESAVRDFTSDPNAILSKAVRQLTTNGHVHRALGDAFEKLYAYTSDEKGIRHSLVLGDNESVGFDEAIFFLSACSAFVSFLSRKRSLTSVAK